MGNYSQHLISLLEIPGKVSGSKQVVVREGEIPHAGTQRMAPHGRDVPRVEAIETLLKFDENVFYLY